MDSGAAKPAGWRIINASQLEGYEWALGLQHGPLDAAVGEVGEYAEALVVVVPHGVHGGVDVVSCTDAAAQAFLERMTAYVTSCCAFGPKFVRVPRQAAELVAV